jgi:hypothetical protein
MKITKSAMILSSTLSLSSIALAAEPAKIADQIIDVEIQSEPMRMSASSKKPSPTLRANTRLSATVAHIEPDGTVSLDCENQHAHQQVQQLQTEPR